MSQDESTLVWTLQGPADRSDWLIAELDAYGFEAFEERPSGVIAYRRETGWTQDVRAAALQTARDVGFRLAAEKREEPQNWNQAWESGIRPIEAGGFCIHPPWHDPIPGYRAICIEPKMSFGTAHHATTRLMLRCLESNVRPGDHVLDAGTGTGVLAIAARLLGARSAVAFDIDPWSQENAIENVERNGVDAVDVRLGGIEQSGPGPFDLVLANINRNVLVEMLPRFAELLPAGGRLVLSGVLVSDRSMMEERLVREGFSEPEVRVEDEWIALVCALPEEQ